MSERFTRLFSLPENLYSEGSPVVISAGALQKDNETGKTFIQVKFKSISSKEIKAIYISINAFDTKGEPIEDDIHYEYLDLSAQRDEEFGQKSAIRLKNASIRAFSVIVDEVIFKDNTSWKSQSYDWKQLPKQKTLSEAIKDKSLLEQYLKKNGTVCKYEVLDYNDLWFCSCGEINHKNEIECRSCRRKIDALKINLDELEEDKKRQIAEEQEIAQKKLEAERKAAEEKKQAKERAAKKSKKIAAIAAPIVCVCIALVIFLIKVVIPNANFNELKNGNYNVGDTVKFGNYHDSDEWIVLDKQDNQALLISKYALDCKQYNSSPTDVTWESCTLRKWLNDDFINEAFTQKEQSIIAMADISADKNPMFDISPGNATLDNVFLLSITEAEKYFSSDDARQCKPTEYAIAKGARVNSGNGNCWWWLRSPGYDQGAAADVRNDGSVLSSGDYVSYAYIAVRPALWISLG